MKNDGHRNITRLLTLVVFGAFALCVAAVLLTGAGTYRTLTQRGSAAHSQRIAARYLTTRFQQAAAVQVEDFCGLPALTDREEIDGKTYVTRVYCYEGTLRELFAAENAPVAPGDGEVILEAESLTFSRADQLLTVEITHPDGRTQRLLLAMPAWKEGHYEE